MSAGRGDVLTVTDEQFEQIEAAWRICASGSRRDRISDALWVQRFDACLLAILGFAPPPIFKLDLAKVHP